ncbi:hypothetical protein HNR77_003110 [Paenibacillus sp. JGP012]|nr:hypothetical protein [Paenibacillus sp. JGP012]
MGDASVSVSVSVSVRVHRLVVGELSIGWAEKEHEQEIQFILR